MYALYSVALAVALLLSAPYYLWKGRRSGRSLRTLGERLAGPSLALFPGQPGSASQSTLEIVDAEVRRIVDACYGTALTRLRENRERLEALARALLDRETLDEKDAYRVAGFPAPSDKELRQRERDAEGAGIALEDPAGAAPSPSDAPG